MGGVDKLDADRRPAARSLVRPLGAIAAAPEVGRIVVVTARRADRRRSRGAAWLPAKRRARRRRRRRGARTPSRPGFAAARPRLTAGDADDREVVLVHDGARPLVADGARRRRSPRRARARGGDPGRARRRDAQADRRRRIGRRDRRARRGSARPRRRRASGRSCSARRSRRFPADGPDDFTDEAALLEACSIPVHAIPGDARNLKVTLPGDLARVDGDRGVRSPRSADRVGATPAGSARVRQPSVRAGRRGSRLGGLDIAGAPRLARPLRRRRRPPRGRRRAARRGRPGRPRPAVPGRTRDAARHRQRATCSPRSSARVRGCRVRASATVDLTIVARPAAARRPPRRRWRRGSRSSSGSTPAAVNVKASTGNLDGMEGAGRGISATRGRDRRDAPAATDDDPPARHADRRGPGRSSRSSRATSGSTAAARRSTARPTSATSGASCSPTSSSATCAGAASAVTWVMNVTDIDDKIIKGAAAGRDVDPGADRPLARPRSGRTPTRLADDARRTSCRGRPSTSTRSSA